MEMEKRTQQITMSEGRSHLMPSEERKWSGMALETTDGQVSIVNISNTTLVNLKRHLLIHQI